MIMTTDGVRVLTSDLITLSGWDQDNMYTCIQEHVYLNPAVTIATSNGIAGSKRHPCSISSLCLLYFGTSQLLLPR